MAFDISFKKKDNFKIKFASKKTDEFVAKDMTVVFEISKMNTIKSKYLVIDRIKNVDISFLPKNNEALKIYTSKNILSSEILQLIENKYKIITAIASFASINEKSVKIFNKYNFIKIYARCDASEKEYRTKRVHDLICTNKPMIKTHIKIFLFECEENTFITIITSSNPSSSASCENYYIYNSKEKYLETLKLLESCK